VGVFIESVSFKVLLIKVMALVPNVVHVAVSKNLNMDHFWHMF